jgi:hypothetical protein
MKKNCSRWLRAWAHTAPMGLGGAMDTVAMNLTVVGRWTQSALTARALASISRSREQDEKSSVKGVTPPG